VLQKNRLIAFVLFLLSAFAAAAQQVAPASFPGQREMAKGNYDKALLRIQKRMAKDSNDVAVNYAAYQLLSDSSYRGCDIERAYTYLSKVQRLFVHAGPKQLDRLARNNFCGALIEYDLRRVCRMAMRHALRERTIDSYDHFLGCYRLAPQEQRDSIAVSRDTIEFLEVCRIGDIAALQSYIADRPSSSLRKAAIAKRNEIAFRLTDSLHTVSAYEAFCLTYPESDEFHAAVDSIHALTFREALAQDSELCYRDYVLRYPDSPWSEKAEWLADSIEFTNEVEAGRWTSYLYYMDNHPDRKWWSREALARAVRLTLENGLVEAARSLIPRIEAADPLRDSLVEMLRAAYMHTSAQNYNAFYDEYGGLVPAERQRADEAAFRLSFDYDFANADIYIRTVAPSREAFRMLQQLLKDDIDYRRWETARNRALEYADAFGNDPDYVRFVALLDAPEEEGLSAEALPVAVNTPKGDEQSPVFAADERTLYFSGRKRADNIGGSDVFVSQRNAKGRWGNARLVMDLSHTYGNEAPVSLSPDGNTMLLLKGSTLCLMEQGPKGWTEGERLPCSINTGSWHADASIAAGGTAIVFAAKGKSEREADSSLNIYVSLLDSNGCWGPALELGPAVNTPFDERSPMLHPDMRTLYFSSEGHGSLGQMDVFVTRRIGDGWTEWTEPMNVGKEVNTTDDDWGFKVSADGRRAYISRRAGLSHDLFCTDLPERAMPHPVTTVTGVVKDSLGRGAASTLFWFDMAGRLVGRCHSAPKSGRYLILLPQGAAYQLSVQDGCVVSDSQTIDLREQAPTTIKRDIYVRMAARQ